MKRFGNCVSVMEVAEDAHLVFDCPEGQNYVEDPTLYVAEITECDDVEETPEPFFTNIRGKLHNFSPKVGSWAAMTQKARRKLLCDLSAKQEEGTQLADLLAENTRLRNSLQALTR